MADVYEDYIKAMIYEDFLNSIEDVRNGDDPDVAHREHERRCAPFRELLRRHEERRARRDQPCDEDRRLVVGGRW